MDLLLTFIDILLHLDVYMDMLIRSYGVWIYAILVIVIFCETGLVLTPFLPGDSLLFAVGTFAAIGSLEIEIVTPALGLAAIAGDSSNYWIGHFTGPKVFHQEKSRFFRKEYLDRTHEFYEKYGRKTIIFARFLPIIRTFAPFVAGIGRMPYVRFVTYSIAGNTAWMCTFIFGGYFFGNIPLVKENFTLVIMAIIIISVMPGVIGYLKQRFKPEK
jgi:membrane-associated protein